MRAALTVWEDRISPVFDVSKETLIIETVNNEVVSREHGLISPQGPLDKIDWLVRRGVDTLICGAVSESIYRELQFYKLTVYGFIAGRVDDVIDAFVRGSLGDEKFLMPGCGGRNRERRRRHRNRGASE